MFKIEYSKMFQLILHFPSQKKFLSKTDFFVKKIQKNYK